MKKRWFVLSFCVILSLMLAAGVTYAFFAGGVQKNVDFTFGKLDASVTITQDAGVVFTDAGQTSTVTLTVGAGADSAPFAYGFTVRSAADTDAALAASVLVSFDGKLLGTAAAVFDGEYEIDPDRYLVSGRVTHELKLEYHLGAGAFHGDKKLNLTIACTAATARTDEVAFVSTADEYITLMRDAEEGRLSDGFRAVLTADIAAAAAKSAVPLTLDLNGHRLDAQLTLAGAGRNRVLTAGAGSVSALILDNPAGFVEIGDDVGVAAATIVSADTAAQAEIMAAQARTRLAAGLTDLPVDVLGGYRAFDGADKIAVSGAGYADGTVMPTQGVDARNEILTLGANLPSGACEVLYTVYGTGTLDDTGDNLRELTATMDAQLTAADGTERTVTYDLLLPVVLRAGASVEWRSSHPDTIAPSGKYTPGSSDFTLTLTAYVRYNGKTAVKEYFAKIKNSKDKAAILREILDAYDSVTFSEPEETFYLPTPLSNVASQQSDAGYDLLSPAEKAKMAAVNALIAESGIQDFSYADEDKLMEDGHLAWNRSVDSFKLVTATGIHRTNLIVTATFADGYVEDSLAVYIDVASVAEAMKYLDGVIGDNGDIAANIRGDRFHRIDAYGNDRSDQAASDADGIYEFHGDATARTFGKDAALGTTVREGSFVLPDRYTNMSGGATFASGSGEKVFYYFYYYLDDSAFFGAENPLADGSTAFAGEPPLSLGADAGAPQVSVSAIPAFNNFFLVDPAALPSAGTTLNLQVALYRADGGAYTLEGTIQNVGITIPGALHNDAEGFESAAVFDRVYEMLRADADVPFSPCALAPADTILAVVCEDVRTFSVDTSADADPLQISSSMKGLSAFANLETLRLVGTESKPLFVPKAGASGDPVIAVMNGALANLTKLTSLTMNYCGVTRIDPVASMPQLRVLDVAHNPQLTDISAATALTALTAMNISYCSFDFVGALTFESPYAEVSVFEAICAADPSGAVRITYSYRETSAATEIKTAVYAAKFSPMTENQRKAKRYLDKFDFSSVTVYKNFKLPCVIRGVSDARLAYRVISEQSANITTGNGSYAQATLNAATGLWNAATLTESSQLTLVSPGAGTTVVLQVVVILTNASGDIADAYYCANFAVTFTA